MRLRILTHATGYRTIVRYCFLAVAIACLGYYSYAYLERVLYQRQESREFDRLAEQTVASAASSEIRKQGATVKISARKFAPSSRPSAQRALIGRLLVPRLHISSMVREGIDADTLQVAIGHIPSTALPGQAGNVGLAGHRDTFFRGLKDLKTQDEIHFSTLSGDFKYVVESIVIVEPSNIGVLANSPERVLTLVTCYPFTFIGAAPKRFIVRARQVSPPTASRSGVE